MNRFGKYAAAVAISLTLVSCTSFNAYRKAKQAEGEKNWDAAVTFYEQALEISPDNTQYRVSLSRAKREASRAHFEKGKQLHAAAQASTGEDQQRLAQLAATELQMTVRLDPTNQYAAVEMSKAIRLVEDYRRAVAESTSIDEVKRRAKASVSKAQPPQLNPASDEPISLTFPRDTPVRDIYKALGNAFGINILFDQAVKDDRITIELRDVTAQQALERVMQAASHFYKALDEKTIIVIPDNPQARRDYEDLVIQTFYLSNGDAEAVTNVVRTMIDARNVFPLKALNAITIRDTADKVRIAEKIIEANDKAKAEVVVQVELIQLDLSRVRNLGFAVSGPAAGTATPRVQGVDDKGNATLVPFTGGTLGDIARVLGSANDLKNNLSFTIPQATYSLLKTLGNSELLASPELRISEGEKATLHIGQRVPVPVSTFTSVATGQPNTGTYAPVTSYQYQDVGIKVGMEPRVHHNREVTLKLNVEVSNLGPKTGDQPSFATRTIDSTIRLKDGETNFLAGLIQRSTTDDETKTPFLGDLPFIGRLFTNTQKGELRTDLVLTMTPHIIRIADITEDDVAPMWVGTINNLSFRGVSPRMESQVNADPFGGGGAGAGAQLFGNSPAGPAAARPVEGTTTASPVPVTPGSGPNDPFRRPNPRLTPQPVPEDDSAALTPTPAGTPAPGLAAASVAATSVAEASISETSEGGLRLPPRIAAQPANIALKPGETRMWNVVAMDVDGLTTRELSFRFDPQAIEVGDVTFGAALAIDPAQPPIVTINRDLGTVRITSSNGKPLAFVSGGEILSLRVMGLTGEATLVINTPELRTAQGQAVGAMIAGGRAKVQ